jgi:hypothetical protein
VKWDNSVSRKETELTKKYMVNLCEEDRVRILVWVKVTHQRTQGDWALCMRDLADEHFPEAERIQVVEDHLNTHDPACLYDVFEPAEAERILDRLDFHYTPKHGSWLNMAENEFSVLDHECLDRYIPNIEILSQATNAWETDRNQSEATVD